MAFFSATISLLLLVLSASSPSVHGSYSPAVDCTSVIYANMFYCASYVGIGSTLDTPEAACCTGVKKILDTNPICLCEALKHPMIPIDVTKATTLPVVCKLKAPPVSACGLPAPGTAPGSGPSSAPAPSPSEENHGSSLIPISGLTFVISGAFMLFSFI